MNTKFHYKLDSRTKRKRSIPIITKRPFSLPFVGSITLTSPVRRDSMMRPASDTLKAKKDEYREVQHIMAQLDKMNEQKYR